MLKEIILAQAYTEGKTEKDPKIGQKIAELENLKNFSKQYIIHSRLKEPDVLLGELLTTVIGTNEQEASKALRKWLAAHNGNHPKTANTAQEYKRATDFKEITDIVLQNGNPTHEKIFKELEEPLLQRIIIDNDLLKEITTKLLKTALKNASNSPKAKQVLDAFKTALKAKNEEIGKCVDAFLIALYKSASIDLKQKEQWATEVLAEKLTGPSKAKLGKLFDSVARNLSLLPILFEQFKDNIQKNKKYAELENAYILDECGEYIAPNSQAEKYLSLQTELNTGCAKKDYVAVIRLEPTDTPSIEELLRNPLIQVCFLNEPKREEKIKTLNPHLFGGKGKESILKFQSKNSCKILLAPVSIGNPPIKDIKIKLEKQTSKALIAGGSYLAPNKREKLISFALDIFSDSIIGAISKAKPELANDPDFKNMFDPIAQSLIPLVVEGAVVNHAPHNKFRKVFEDIIIGNIQKLIDAIKPLRNPSEMEFTQMAKILTDAIDGMALEFQKSYTEKK